MLENLVNLVKQFAGDAVVNNPDVPNEHNDAVVAETTHAIAGGLQNELASGGLSNVMSLFNGSGTQGGIMNNPVVSNIISNLTNTLKNKFGLGHDQATNVAGNLVPNVMTNLVNQTNDPNNKSFDINSIIGSLTGGGGTSQSSSGGGFDFGNLISKFTGGGLDANHDGHVGLDDIISKVKDGAQQAQDGSSGGGLMDMIRKFI
ncbi:MAG: hypothetical protein ABJA78_05710 [Ferruginibacter sp.]